MSLMRYRKSDVMMKRNELIIKGGSNKPLSDRINRRSKYGEFGL